MTTTAPTPAVEATSDMAHTPDPATQALPAQRAAAAARPTLRGQIAENPLLSFLGGLIVMLLTAAVASPHLRINDTNDRLDRIEDAMHAGFAALNNKIDTNHDELDNKIDTKFAELDNKIDTNYDELDNKIDTKFTELDNKIDTKFTELDNKIDTKIAELDNKIDTKIAELDNKIDTKFTELDNKIDQLDDRLDRIELKLAELITALQTSGVIASAAPASDGTGEST